MSVIEKLTEFLNSLMMKYELQYTWCIEHGCHGFIRSSLTLSIVLLSECTRGGPCQHGFMCGRKQWSNDINESN